MRLVCRADGRFAAEPSLGAGVSRMLDRLRPAVGAQAVLHRCLAFSTRRL